MMLNVSDFPLFENSLSIFVMYFVSTKLSAVYGNCGQS